MQELISPRAADIFVSVASLLLLVGCAIAGHRAAGGRGLWAGAVGPLVFLLWCFHKWITRYDPHTHYFGLESLAVLVGEVVGFVVLGLMLGRVWENLAKGGAESGGTTDVAG